MAIFERFIYQGVEGIRTGRIKGINSTFVNYRIDDTLIDCGPSGQWRRLRPFFQEKTIRQILVTHYHYDHSGNSRALQDEFGITPVAHKKTAYYLRDGSPFSLMNKVIWGNVPPTVIQPIPEKLTLLDGSVITPIHTPGHSPDMHCYLVSDKGWLFTADLFIARTVKLLYEKEDLAQLVQDIRNILNVDFDTIFCPHRGVVTQGKNAFQTKLNNILDLCDRAQTLSQQGKAIPQITRELLGPEQAASYISRFKFSKRQLIKGCLQVPL